MVYILYDRKFPDKISTSPPEKRHESLKKSKIECNRDRVFQGNLFESNSSHDRYRKGISRECQCREENERYFEEMVHARNCIEKAEKIFSA